MAHKFNPFIAYVINETDDGLYLSDGHGYVVESEELITIGKGLISYAKKHKNDIIKHNENRKQEMQKELCQWSKISETPK